MLGKIKKYVLNSALLSSKLFASNKRWLKIIRYDDEYSLATLHLQVDIGF